MGVQPKFFEFNLMLDDKTANFLSVDWLKEAQVKMSAGKFKAVTVRFIEIVDWDTTKMRAFFHAVVLPAFRRKINDAYKHPRENGHFSSDLVKRFLKAKYLGFVHDSTYECMGSVIDENKHLKDILCFIKFEEMQEKMVTPFEIAHTEDLTPEQYWQFLNECEAYYFDRFHDMYNLREKPQLPS